MIKAKQNTGVWPVALTPFKEDGRIDFTAYRHLLDYYTTNGAAGIFAVCLSSELYQLEPDERLRLARITREHLGPDFPVAACGGFGRTPAEKCDSVKAMRDTGVDAVVLPVCQAPGAEATEQELAAGILSIVEGVPGTFFGLYECPVPFHRLLAPETLGELARQAAGRIVFLKDTCCDAETIRRKLNACAGTGLAVYNANTTTCLESLRDGAAGYSGTSANYLLPELAELCSVFADDPARAEELQLLLQVMQRQVDFKYPRAAKIFLGMQGVKIGDYCRVGCAGFSPEDHRILKSFHQYITRIEGDKNHAEPSALHTDRAPGRHRNHRDSRLDAAAGS